MSLKKEECILYNDVCDQCGKTIPLDNSEYCVLSAVGEFSASAETQLFIRHRGKNVDVFSSDLSFCSPKCAGKFIENKFKTLLKC